MIKIEKTWMRYIKNQMDSMILKNKKLANHLQMLRKLRNFVLKNK